MLTADECHRYGTEGKEMAQSKLGDDTWVDRDLERQHDRGRRNIDSNTGGVFYKYDLSEARATR